MNPEDIIVKIRQTENLLKQFKDVSVHISKIELGQQTYDDFCHYINEQTIIKDMKFSVTSFMGIPIEKIDYIDGVYFKIKIN